MKQKIYRIVSGVAAIFGLIIAFENIAIPANGMMIGLEVMTGTLFVPLILVFFVGFTSGFFFALSQRGEDAPGKSSDHYDI